MPGGFLVSLSHNLLDVATEDIKQFIDILALKQMSVFQEDVGIESDNEMLEDSDKWVLSEDSDGLDSDDEETRDFGFEFDKDCCEKVEENVNFF